MANIFHVERTVNKITLGTTGTTINIASHTASKILALDASKDLEVVTVGTSLDYTRPTLNTVQDIRTTASPTFAGITIADGGTIGQAAGPLLTFDDTNNYLGITGCKVGIGVIDPHSKLEVNGAISSGTTPITASSDTTNVSGVNTLFVDTTSGDVTLGGLVGGVDGQLLSIIKIVAVNDLILEHEEGIGGDTNDFFMHQLGDEIIDAGGVVVVYNGTTEKWYDTSHAKHV